MFGEKIQSVIFAVRLITNARGSTLNFKSSRAEATLQLTLRKQYF